MKIKCLMITLFILLGASFARSTNISGQIEYFYMTRLDNSQLVNIPFRLLDFNIQHQVTDDFNIMGNFGIEYRNRKDTDFMEDSNLEEFLLDIRELYMSYYFNNSEVRVGKQIHSWGSVDENSPIDNLNAYDYYYLLLGGSEKKLGAYSLAFDTEIDMFGPFQLSFVYSPMHNTSRLPINDPDYPIGLPEGSSPSAQNTIFNDNTPGEFSANLKWSFGLGDISFSYLNLYDRIFNVSGLNVYDATTWSNAPNGGNGGQNLQLYYSYRLTQVNNIGAVFLFDDFTLSFDYANFDTKDPNSKEDFNTFHPTSPDVFTFEERPDFFVFTDENGDSTGVASIHFNERAKYTQLAVQFEMPLENDYTLNMQYFKHKLYQYSYNPLPIDESIDITNVDIDVDSFNFEDLFIPGVGTPYAMITSEALLINIKKVFPDYDLTLDLNAFLDATGGNGRLLSFEAEYDLGESFEVSIGMTKIFGDDSIENYNFNNMTSFSSFRSGITYYF